MRNIVTANQTGPWRERERVAGRGSRDQYPRWRPRLHNWGFTINQSELIQEHRATPSQTDLLMPTKSNCTTGFRNLGGILLLLSMAIQANALEPWKCFEPNRPDERRVGKEC